MTHPYRLTEVEQFTLDFAVGFNDVHLLEDCYQSLNFNELVQETTELAAVKNHSLEQEPAAMTVKYSPVSSPSTMCVNQYITNWPGDVGFSVCFDNEPKKGKSMTWTFSDTYRKLYVSMNKFFPIHFVTEHAPPQGSVVCVVAAFRESNFRMENVGRCPEHSGVKDKSNNLDGERHPHPEHWIRCDHPSTRYCQDSRNGGRHCLCIPFEERDPHNNDVFTYRLAFMCRNTCPGGPSRRATDVVFILQNPVGQDIARNVLQVKVCACPGRDRKHDEDAQNALICGTTAQLPTKKRAFAARQRTRYSRPVARFPVVDSVDQSTAGPSTSYLPALRDSNVHDGSSSDSAGEESPPYTVTIRCKRTYETLRPIHKVMEIVETIRSRSVAAEPSQDRSFTAGTREGRQVDMSTDMSSD